MENPSLHVKKLLEGIPNDLHFELHREMRKEKIEEVTDQVSSLINELLKIDDPKKLRYFQSHLSREIERLNTFQNGLITGGLSQFTPEFRGEFLEQEIFLLEIKKILISALLVVTDALNILDQNNSEE